MNKVVWLLLSLVMALCMSGCSGFHLGRELGEQQAGVSQEETSGYVNKAQILEGDDATEVTEDQQDETETEYNASTEMTEPERRNEVFYLGDTITHEFFGMKSEYTLEKVDVVDNINDLGISREDVVEFLRDQISEAGEPDTVQPSKFVVVTVKVKNVNIDPNDNEQNWMLCMDSRAGCESGILAEGGSMSLEGCYYSAHMEGDDYWRYSLGIGEEMTVQVGWIVPEEQLEEPFYYIIGSGAAELYQYFRLNPEE